ncbi:MAG: hypothetical protein PHC61_02625 [Chitinivibrionales bacterium]|nr:hypothetical protein [Chitinivibrionales bacterium]
MPLDKNQKKNAAPDAAAGSDPLNKARAAFEAYRKRVGGVKKPLAGPSSVGASDHAAPAGGFPPQVAPGPMQMPPMAWPQNPGKPFPQAPMPMPFPGAMPGQMGAPAMPGMDSPLAQSIGTMLKVGVTFATAAFAGGLQVMQGFMGDPARCGEEHWEHDRDERGCGCRPEPFCGGHYGHHGHDSHCCNPGVHNCDC